MSSYITDKVPSLNFKTADDIERIIASVDPSRGLQLNDAIDIIRKSAKVDALPPGRSPFVKDAEPGHYAVFLGSDRNKLKHVFHAEVLPNQGGLRMFDPQNGQVVRMGDLDSLRIKWGGHRKSPIVPVFIRGSE
ncbi:MAG: hypothetical protein OEZ68_21450 [Gammaproteobacteria bacterium]|nr:hypothetical protein [Gammaproteobacteria bacterium]